MTLYRQHSRHSKMEGGHIQSNGRRMRNTITCHSQDENLALFSDLRTQERNNFLHPSDIDDADTSFSTEIRKFTSFGNFPSTTPPWKSKGLLASDNEKNDYDWLLTPPATPLFPSLDTNLPPTHVEKSQYNQTHSTSSMSKLLRRPAARKVCNGNQLAKRSRSSSVPSTNHRSNVAAKITNARPTRHTAIDPSFARPGHASSFRSSSFRSSSIEMYASPSNRKSRGVSLSPTSRAASQRRLQAETPPNLCSTRAEWARYHSKTTSAHLKPGATNTDFEGLDTGEICRQPKSFSFDSRRPSSITSLDFLSFKEPIPDNLLVTLPMSTRRGKKAECQRLANAISNQHTSTKGLDYCNGSTPKSRVRPAHSTNVAPTLCQHDRAREMHYSTTNPHFKPSKNNISRSRQEAELSDQESIDEAGAKESKDKWKHTTFSNAARKADSNMNQKHVILYKDQVKSSAKANSNGASLQPMLIEAGFDEPVHKRLADVFLDKNSQDSTKQPQVDILEPSQACHLPLTTHNHEDKAVGPYAASHVENEQASHQDKVKKFITESPLPIWSLITNQARKQLRNVRDRLSCFRREALKVEEQKVEHNKQARRPLEKIDAVDMRVATIQNPTPFDGMQRSDSRLKKIESSAVKEKYLIKLPANAYCQCSIM